MLHQQAVNEAQHLLENGLGGRQEGSAETGKGKGCFAGTLHWMIAGGKKTGEISLTQTERLCQTTCGNGRQTDGVVGILTVLTLCHLACQLASTERDALSAGVSSCPAPIFVLR
jgi:hypothetical protein